MNPATLADILVLVHLSFVAFVVLGQLAILLAWIFKGRWARNFWFRLIHLAAISFVAVEGIFDVECPVTVWERNLRARAGQEVFQVPFIPRMANRILFYPGIPHKYFEWAHIGFGGLVLLTFVFFPPRLPGKNPGKENQKSMAASPPAV
ncbi:MAG: DUF2784 domain-containing protein [Gemmataceae bacterium]|nr:DUF2784 domain-containing protein [Gemmataceae bacterium]